MAEVVLYEPRGCIGTFFYCPLPRFISELSKGLGEREASALPCLYLVGKGQPFGCTDVVLTHELFKGTPSLCVVQVLLGYMRPSRDASFLGLCGPSIGREHTPKAVEVFVRCLSGCRTVAR